MKTYRELCSFLMSLTITLSVPVCLAKTTDSSIKKIASAHQLQARKKIKFKNPVLVDAQLNADMAQQKALDLSLSIDNLEKSPLNLSPNYSIEAATNSIFAATSKPPRTLLLDGQLIMSPEPEADKKKSMDGAGISINLKR